MQNLGVWKSWKKLQAYLLLTLVAKQGPRTKFDNIKLKVLAERKLQKKITCVHKFQVPHSHHGIKRAEDTEG